MMKYVLFHLICENMLFLEKKCYFLFKILRICIKRCQKNRYFDKNNDIFKIVLLKNKSGFAKTNVINMLFIFIQLLYKIMFFISKK